MIATLTTRSREFDAATSGIGEIRFDPVAEFKAGNRSIEADVRASTLGV